MHGIDVDDLYLNYCIGMKLEPPRNGISMRLNAAVAVTIYIIWFQRELSYCHV